MYPSLSLQVPDHEKDIILVEGRDAAPKSVHANAVPTPSKSPLQKSGVSCKTECRSTEEELMWNGHRSTVCPGRSGLTTRDATVPLLASKGASLSFVELLNEWGTLCQRVYTSLSSGDCFSSCCIHRRLEKASYGRSAPAQVSSCGG